MAQGLPGFAISGLGDSAVKQSSDRIKAVAATIEDLPVSQRRVTVNLSPAGERKIGTGFDLGIFVAVAAALGVVKDAVVADVVHIGEIGLDGTVRAVPGVLPLVRAAALAGVRHVVVPGRQRRRGEAGARESGCTRWPRSPSWCVAMTRCARGRAVEEVQVPPGPRRGRSSTRTSPRSWARRRPGRPRDGRGASPAARRPAGRRQDDARRAAARRAAGTRRRGVDGGHRDPLRARALGSSVGGGQLVTRPPFVAPHHGASQAAVVGGGSGHIRPGRSRRPTAASSSSTRPPVRRRSSRRCGTPLETGRVGGPGRPTGTFPARSQLVIAANPCPCGNGGARARGRCS